MGAREIYDNLCRACASVYGDAIGLSYPVLREAAGGEMEMAAYVFQAPTEEESRAGRIPRPTAYATADLQLGGVTGVHDARQEEFSDAPYGGVDVSNPSGMQDLDKDAAFARLDEAVAGAREGRAGWERGYYAYLEMVMRDIPVGYRRFYLDLGLNFTAAA